MALNIKDPETERLVSEVAERTKQSKTAAVRNAMRDRLAELRAQETAERRRERFHRFLEEEIWPMIPSDQRGTRITKAEREEILGLGPDGV